MVYSAQNQKQRIIIMIGNFTAVVKNVELIEHRFQKDNPQQIEIRIEFECEDAKGSCYKDLSVMKWIEKGPDAGKRACDATMDTMAKLGIDMRTNPYNVSKMIGNSYEFYGVESDKYGTTYYLSTLSDKKADESLVRKAFSEMLSGFSAPAQTQQPVAQQFQQPVAQQFQQPVQQPAQQPVQQPAPNGAPDLSQFLKPQPAQGQQPAAPKGWV